jgi:PAS domain S-box-containing protein
MSLEDFLSKRHGQLAVILPSRSHLFTFTPIFPGHAFLLFEKQGKGMTGIPTGLKAAIQEFVRNNPDAMVTVIDSAKIFRYASPSSLPLFGYEPADIVGRPLSDFFGELDIAHLKLVIQDAILNSESVMTSRDVLLRFGGTKCMRGPAHGFYDRKTRQAYALAIGRPCDKS